MLKLVTIFDTDIEVKIIFVVLTDIKTEWKIKTDRWYILKC